MKGHPQRYIPGHQNRRSPIEYVEEDRGYETLCWIWQLHIGTHGYGSATHEGKQTTAPRVYYIRHRGPIQKGLEPDHLCRVHACVNPWHLEIVTRRENVRRGLAGHRPAKELRRLTDADVVEIRRSDKSSRALAVVYGVSRETVRFARLGKHYAEVDR